MGTSWRPDAREPPRVWFTSGPVSEWSDWYRQEDPTQWVLPRVLRERADTHPDRDYLRFGDGAWLSYGEVNARTNRIANALIASGLRKGEAVSMLMPNCEDNLPAWFGIQKAGGVQCPVNTAYRGDFLTWVINLPQARFLIISDEFLDRLDRITGELPHLERVFVWRSPEANGPDPAVRWEPFDALWDASDAEPDVEVRWTDDARIMFTSGTTGRSKGAVKQQASDYFSGRTYNNVCEVTEDDTLLLVSSAVSLERPGAGGLSGDDRRRARRLLSPLFRPALLAAGRSTPRRRCSTRSAQSTTSSGTRRRASWIALTASARSWRCPHPRTSSRRSRSASASASPRGTD